MTKVDLAAHLHAIAAVDEDAPVSVTIAKSLRCR